MGLKIKHTIKGRTLATALETMACHTKWPVISGFSFPMADVSRPLAGQPTRRPVIRGNIAVRYRNLVLGNMEL